MNETAARWRDHSEWPLIFDESDRLIAETLWRRAMEIDPRVGPASPDDDDLLVAFLHLARAQRHQHVALALEPESLARHLATQETGGTVNTDNVIGDDALVDPTSQRGSLHEARRLIVALMNRDHPVVNAIVATSDLGDDVDLDGAPVIVTTVGGVAAFVHLRRLARAEFTLATALLRASREEANDPLSTVVLPDSSLDDPVAHEVAQRLLRRHISVITGGPGTGKTTSVARVLMALRDAWADRASDAPLRVALCAPTAKAAVRLRDVLETAFAASASNARVADALVIHERSGSVHRLLRISPRRPVASEDVDADIVIVDEVSMLELPLISQLVDRLGANSRLVLVGDADQLASVNVGAALRDIVDAAHNDGPLVSLVTHLAVNHRSNVTIGALAEAINRGDLAAVRTVAREHPAVVSLGEEIAGAVERAHAHAHALVTSALARDVAGAIGHLDDMAVLCATRQGPRSVAWWQIALGSVARTLSAPSPSLAVGTPMLVTRNESTTSNDDVALSNGDLGVVMDSADSVNVVFGPARAPRWRVADQVRGIEPAWALTIHKSQGSEYGEVVVSLPERDTALLSRELLYTAVTRARERVTVISSPEVLAATLARRVARVSAIGERVSAQSRARIERTE